MLRRQLVEHGERLLGAGADLVPPHVLVDQVSGAINKTEELTKELRELRTELRRYKVTSKTDRANGVAIRRENVSMFFVVPIGFFVGYLLFKKVM